jgi:hypothetical protein
MEQQAGAHVALNKGKVYNNMQGFMVEADAYKASQHFSWSSFIKQLLLASESMYETQIIKCNRSIKCNAQV